MRLIQKLFFRLKDVIPNKETTTYGYKFLWKLSPLMLLALCYYTYLETLSNLDMMTLLDLKRK